MTPQVQPSRRRIIQFGILTSQGLQSAQMRRCRDLEILQNITSPDLDEQISGGVEKQGHAVEENIGG